MSRKRGATTKQINAIRTYSKKGWSANRIQQKMKARHMGMRRTKLLTYVREFKRQPAKPSVERYTPTKYAGAREGARIGFFQKQIAVWRGDRRVQMVGTGTQLKSAMRLVIKHPPKKRFLTLSAEALLDDPREYLDMKHEWSDRPNVESR